MLELDVMAALSGIGRPVKMARREEVKSILRRL
jgi:hypothetical protein